MDDALHNCNEGELLGMARTQGLPPLRRGLPRADLLAIVTGQAEPTKDQIADTEYTRRQLENFITKNFAIVRSQLPGCNGKCLTFHCSEGRHMACFAPNEANVQ